ncbi:MAG TPA: hypothetical protein VF062_04995 [Candidatus Limnocylindrales bacterium]
MPETEDLTEVEQSAIFNAFARTTGTNNVSPLLAAVHDIVAAREAAARREAHRIIERCLRLRNEDGTHKVPANARNIIRAAMYGESS